MSEQTDTSTEIYFAGVEDRMSQTDTKHPLMKTLEEIGAELKASGKYEPGEPLIDKLRREIAALQQQAEQKDAEIEGLNQRIQLAGGYHHRTEREVEIREALEQTEESERDSADNTIAELLTLVDAGRNRVYLAEEQLRESQAQERALRAILEPLRDGKWFKDGKAGAILCSLDADSVRVALSSPAPKVIPEEDVTPLREKLGLLKLLGGLRQISSNTETNIIARNIAEGTIKEWQILTNPNT